MLMRRTNIPRIATLCRSMFIQGMKQPEAAATEWQTTMSIVGIQQVAEVAMEQ